MQASEYVPILIYYSTISRIKPNVENTLSTQPKITGQKWKLEINLQKPYVNLLSRVMASVNDNSHSKNFMVFVKNYREITLTLRKFMFYVCMKLT